MEYGKIGNQQYAMGSEEVHVYMEAGGMEVLEEPALRPSELIKENQNRSMSLISGKFSIIRSIEGKNRMKIKGKS